MSKKLVVLARFSEYGIPESTVFILNKKKSSKDYPQILDKCDTSNVDEISFYCMDVHAASFLRSEIQRSSFLRRQVWKNHSTLLETGAVVLQILLKEPIRYHMDQRFGSQVQLLVNEKIELDHIMSCLSTLGGAFSSLGDQFLDCAKIAGKISLQQYKIAEKLCDPVTLMRCQLYLSISLIQCNRFKNAKIVITSVYRSMKSRPEELQDKRVISMCLGIWAKLKYHWYLEKKQIYIT
ncbi:hypothetical protein DAPPUDRAFT_221500 [Daphnia pulex]|uniref:Uncharacterized protein n=1 Tax=Daphnia pulex TaxID=6669 RepID=E9FYI1_DAPPU|nr:hypothetical protein DAPPUDRAFT_221500 [Daphnia pulex]|eukprot:EFX87763.1 hypothetical protein DAPPUDRAFT_221500 [Daphnia pulex]